jgi:signal transduction histidine kinase
LRAEFKTDLEEHLPQAVEEALYRIALEALNNALKHAQAQQIKVRLHQQEPQSRIVTLEITDDGVGFDLATVHQRGGVGLSTMEERAEAIGAKLKIESKAGSGSKVTVVWG